MAKWITEHPNSKMVIKNRLTIDKTKNWLVIKNDKGEYLKKDYKPYPAQMNFVKYWGDASYYCGSPSSGNSYTVFTEAKELNSKVFCLTKAGDIEIFEKDFKYAS
jgi:hypothetical protein